MELQGTTGTLAVIEPTETSVPQLSVTEGPFSVAETMITTVKEGSGEVVPDLCEVTVDYHGVNGRDGSVFDSSFQRGEPVSFPLNGVVAGFAKAIAGQRVGSDVVVAMTPEDGYGPNGNPRAGIQGTDTLTFYIRIHAID